MAEFLALLWPHPLLLDEKELALAWMLFDELTEVLVFFRLGEILVLRCTALYYALEAFLELRVLL